MKIFIRRMILLTLILIVLFSYMNTSSKADVSITIGTGGTAGVYYPTGMNICSMINSKPEYGINCTAISTGGSVYNINSVLADTMEFGIAQSDLQYAAWNGEDEWQETGAQANLRSVFSIHHEAVTLVAGSDTGIKSMQDLKGKIVNIGREGTGGRKNAIDALGNEGINYLTDLTATIYNINEALTRFQNNEIDAFFITVGHPSDFITNAVQGQRSIYFVPIVNISSLLANYPYYSEATIPIHHYPGVTNSANVQTFGVKATLVTAVNVSDNVVYALTKEVFENFESFQPLHPAYETLTRCDMLKALTAPIHVGATTYHKEASVCAIRTMPAVPLLLLED